jgi:hypothetical protein
VVSVVFAAAALVLAIRDVRRRPVAESVAH